MGFIDTMRAQGFAVESICQVLREQGVQVAARTYRAWKAPGRQVAARTISDAVLADALLGARTSSDGRPTPESLYGRRKMTALLRRRGLAVAHCTVDRLMRELGMHGVRRGKQPRTTTSSTDTAARAGDLLDRDFTAPAPNRVWIADFTYVRTWAAMVYVAFVVDVYAQGIVGWHTMSTRPAELVLLPLRMAARARGQQGHPIARGELVHHSDAWAVSRYPVHRAPTAGRDHASVGSVGDAYDNALMESIIGLYKDECVRPGPFHTGPFKTLSEVEFATMAWVDWYNHRRLHTTLGMRTPAEHEAAHYTATAAFQPEPQPI